MLGTVVAYVDDVLVTIFCILHTYDGKVMYMYSEIHYKNVIPFVDNIY